MGSVGFMERVLPEKDYPVLRQTIKPPAMGRNPITTDVQHTSESAPGIWTALRRSATLAGASVDVRNETAKGDYAGGDGRERPATRRHSQAAQGKGL